MKIISYSDLHLEFDTDFKPPADSDADVMILAGDIITFGDYKPLTRFLSDWKKPVLFVAGNHEYYTNTAMSKESQRFKEWLATKHPAYNGGAIFNSGNDNAVLSTTLYDGTNVETYKNSSLLDSDIADSTGMLLTTEQYAQFWHMHSSYFTPQ